MDYDLPPEFDLIVVGTGVVESIISAAASRIGKRVLQVDSNDYYGGHWASFNLEDIQKLGKESITDVDHELYKNLKEEGSSFIPLGNKFRQLLHFRTKWHVCNIDDNKHSFNTEKIGDELDDSFLNKEDVKELQSDQNIPTENVQHCSEVIADKELLVEELGASKDEDVKIMAEKIVEKADVITQESLRRDYRKFIIDLCPKLQFARGDFVELLISSNIARYVEFRSVSRVLTWINGDIEVVPCSRSDVFANNKVSVVEKRMLMKLLTSIETDEKDSSVSEGTTYKELLKGKKLSDNIIHFVLYALSMSTDNTLWIDGIRSTKRFLQSLGRFGKTPFLFSMYGSGEITQAFCRLSAVFGGIFALNQRLHGIILNKDNNFDSLICGKQRISAPHIVMDVGLAPEIFVKKSDDSLISRAIFITDRSLMESEKEHMTLLLYPAKNSNLCTLLEVGFLTGTCPKNLFLVHLTTKGSSNPNDDLDNCVRDLFNLEAADEMCRKPKVLWSCYFSIPDTNELDLRSCAPSNVFLCPGPDLDLDYDGSVKKARETFSSIYPNEEFLPRAPDADEIIIGEDPETATEVKTLVSDNENSAECEKASKETEEESEFSIIEEKTTKLSQTEIAVEARASTSNLNTSSQINDTSLTENKVQKVDECSEAKEELQ